MSIRSAVMYVFFDARPHQVGQFLLSSGFCDTDEESEEKCQALAGSLQKVAFFLSFIFTKLDATTSILFSPSLLQTGES